MTVSYLDLPVPKGARVIQPVVVLTSGSVVPLPVGTKAHMQIRRNAESDIVLADLSTDNGKLLIDINTATVTINMSSAFTDTFDFDRGVFDIDLIYPDTQKERIVEGKVWVKLSVTQD